MRLHGNMGKRQNLEGKRFGRLTAVSPTEKRESTGCVKWLCKCDCGRETIVSVNALNMGNTKSCGCLHIDTIRLRDARLFPSTYLGVLTTHQSKEVPYSTTLLSDP